MSNAAHIPDSGKQKGLKLLRYARIYGWKRALVKASGRSRLPLPSLNGLHPKDPTRKIGIIGCGQFAYTTLCYFLREELNPVFTMAYDTHAEQAQTLARQYGIKQVAASAEELIAHSGTDTIYIASDHASHAPYAIQALRAGKTVYLEKPVATTWQQLQELQAALAETKGRIVAGYNRPYAPAIRELRQRMQPSDGPFTLQCTVHTHLLPAGHWYRQPEQGTRICGNMGHWLDLAVHLLYTRDRLPENVHISLNWADDAEPDDNITAVLSTSLHDLVVITLSARHEPFEGISESIHFQNPAFSAIIDDFRSATFKTGSRIKTYCYHPKDIGHRQAALQPFLSSEETRNWQEVTDSSRLMLQIADMVRAGSRSGTFLWSPAAFPGQQH